MITYPPNTTPVIQEEIVAELDRQVRALPDGDYAAHLALLHGEAVYYDATRYGITDPPRWRPRIKVLPELSLDCPGSNPWLLCNIRIRRNRRACPRCGHPIMDHVRRVAHGDNTVQYLGKCHTCDCNWYGERAVAYV